MHLIYFQINVHCTYILTSMYKVLQHDLPNHECSNAQNYNFKRNLLHDKVYSRSLLHRKKIICLPITVSFEETTLHLFRDCPSWQIDELVVETTEYMLHIKSSSIIT